MEVLKLRPKQKTVTTNMTATTTIQFDQGLPPALTKVVPISKGELRVINTYPHNKKEKGLVPVPTPQGGICGFTPISWRTNNGRLSQTRSPNEKLEYLLVT